MAELDPNPRSIDQAYDLGFCDRMNCTETIASENIRLRAEALDRCERCALHQAVVDLQAMERQRNIWWWFGIACFALALLFAAK